MDKEKRRERGYPDPSRGVKKSKTAKANAASNYLTQNSH